MSREIILKISGLSKVYAQRSFLKVNKVLAVDSLDLEVVRGEIFGFLGPNGAGKTTTLNMIVGIMASSAGTVEIFGRTSIGRDIEPLRRLGYIPEVTSLPGYLSVFELLDFYAQLFNIPRAVQKERIAQLLDLLGLSKESHVLLRNLSMGQRRLVDFLLALINDPDLILMDEPTVYLDPVILDRLRKILVHLKGEGKTIVMSSHMLSEVEKLSDRVAIIDRGRLLKIGPKADFLRQGSMEEEFLRIIKHEGEVNA